MGNNQQRPEQNNNSIFSCSIRCQNGNTIQFCKAEQEMIQNCQTQVQRKRQIIYFKNFGSKKQSQNLKNESINSKKQEQLVKLQSILQERKKTNNPFSTSALWKLVYKLCQGTYLLQNIIGSKQIDFQNIFCDKYLRQIKISSIDSQKQYVELKIGLIMAQCVFLQKNDVQIDAELLELIIKEILCTSYYSLQLKVIISGLLIVNEYLRFSYRQIYTILCSYKQQIQNQSPFRLTKNLFYKTFGFKMKYFQDIFKQISNQHKKQLFQKGYSVILGPNSNKNINLQSNLSQFSQSLVYSFSQNLHPTPRQQLSVNFSKVDIKSTNQEIVDIIENQVKSIQLLQKQPAKQYDNISENSFKIIESQVQPQKMTLYQPFKQIQIKRTQSYDYYSQSRSSYSLIQQKNNNKQLQNSSLLQSSVIDRLNKQYSQTQKQSQTLRLSSRLKQQSTLTIPSPKTQSFKRRKQIISNLHKFQIPKFNQHISQQKSYQQKQEFSQGKFRNKLTSSELKIIIPGQQIQKQQQ